MELFPHHHHVQLIAGAEGYAELTAAGAPAIAAAPAPEFDGPGDAWTPEHLLLAAVETCFLFTFRTAAQKANITFQSLELATGGTVHRMMGVARFAEIVLRPTIRIDVNVSRDLVTRLLTDTATSCIVAASLSTPIRVEPVVFQAEQPRQPATNAA
jgi:organic hydroperoxide reductase OsmC/OhrA